MIWAAVLAGSVACYGLKLIGLSVPDRVLDEPRVRRVAGLLPVALLSALIGLQVLTDGSRLTVDARLLGLAAAIVAQWRRAPFLVVVGGACAVTALARAVT